MWEASKLCSYSQEYLSFLSRKKLLKATKINNKWQTTIEWLNEYLADKKPGEFIRTENVKQRLFQNNIEVKKRWIVAISIFFLFFSTVFVFDQMSNKISELEQKTDQIAGKQKVQVGNMSLNFLQTDSSGKENKY